MAKPGRRKGHRNRGYFYRKGRGWVASDRGKMVPITFQDGIPIRDRQVEESVLKDVYARFLVDKQAADAAADKPGADAQQVSVEEVCLAYLADLKVNGAEQTFEVRADTLFDFCYGLPARFRTKDGKPKRLTKALREEAAKARIHRGYGRLPIDEVIPLHIDQWLNAHKRWKGCRRTRIQAVKRAINYCVEKGLIPKNPLCPLRIASNPGIVV